MSITGSSGEIKLFRGLKNALGEDEDQVAWDILENDEAHGKAEKDRDEVHDFLIDCLRRS